jgi:hypothetical protein
VVHGQLGRDELRRRVGGAGGGLPLVAPAPVLVEAVVAAEATDPPVVRRQVGRVMRRLLIA